MTQLNTDRGRVVTLGRELGRGGEGFVFEVLGDTSQVAKIYHQAPAAEKAQKLKAMASGCTDALKKVAAWPSETLHLANSGATVGFLMRRVERHKDIHIVYGPKTRLREYPNATFRLLVRVASNLARAFQVVHDHGHVVGDVNSGGACVSAQGTITLVDCDSFQVRSATKIFSCDVGIPIFQPPEFQTLSSYRGVLRHERNDCFGLAVLIFQTLFLARHPFAGRYIDPGDMPIEQAIREFRFPYARDAEQRRMQPPPASLQLGSVTPLLAQQFERAFLESGVHDRPTARDWSRALDDFEALLQTCTANPAHAYVRSLASCPLCNIEARTKLKLFLPPLPPGAATAALVDLEQLWADVTHAVQRVDLRSLALAKTPRQSMQPAWRPVRGDHARNLAFTAGFAVVVAGLAIHPALLLLIGIVALVYWATSGQQREERRVAQTALADAKKQHADVLKTITNETRTNVLYPTVDELDALRKKEHELGARRVERLRDLDKGKSERQRSRFLDSFLISDAKLKGIGPGLVATLESYGVETADDVEPGALLGIPSFGPKRQEKLLAWKQEVLRGFVFRADDPADAAETKRIEQEILSERAKVHALFASKASHLHTLISQSEARAADLRKQHADVEATLLRVTAEAQAVGVEVTS